MALSDFSLPSFDITMPDFTMPTFDFSVPQFDFTASLPSLPSFDYTSILPSMDTGNYLNGILPAFPTAQDFTLSSTPADLALLQDINAMGTQDLTNALSAQGMTPAEITTYLDNAALSNSIDAMGTQDLTTLLANQGFSQPAIVDYMAQQGVMPITDIQAAMDAANSPYSSGIYDTSVPLDQSVVNPLYGGSTITQNTANGTVDLPISAVTAQMDASNQIRDAITTQMLANGATQSQIDAAVTAATGVDAANPTVGGVPAIPAAASPLSKAATALANALKQAPASKSNASPAVQNGLATANAVTQIAAPWFTKNGKSPAPRAGAEVSTRGMKWAGPQKKASGGSVRGAQRPARGGLGLLAAATGGQDDVVPVAAAGGEYVMDADTVSALGDGNTDAGAAKLDQMRHNIRKHKRSAPADKIPPRAKTPLAYLKG